MPYLTNQNLFTILLRLNVFGNRPTESSSLKVLRAPEMGWARDKVVALYRAECA